MLRSILSPSECAECKFCCSFRRCSLWETPRFDAEQTAELQRKYPRAKFKSVDGVYTIDIDGCYKTDDPEEEALCWFNEGKGCILGEDKPFECAVWPLRVMRKDSQLVIVLSPGCRVLSSKPLSDIQRLVDAGLGEKMLEHARKIPEYVREYREGYPVLMVSQEEE